MAAKLKSPKHTGAAISRKQSVAPVDVDSGQRPVLFMAQRLGLTFRRVSGKEVVQGMAATAIVLFLIGLITPISGLGWIAISLDGMMIFGFALAVVSLDRAVLGDKRLGRLKWLTAISMTSIHCVSWFILT